MTSHRVSALGCPVPSSLMPLATAGLLKLLMPAATCDATLRARVERRLARAGFTPQQVGVEVQGGHVVLAGRLSSWIERSRARREAARETPLVHNHVRVAPRRWR